MYVGPITCILYLKDAESAAAAGGRKVAAEKSIEWGTENGMDQEGGVNEQHRETL